MALKPFDWRLNCVRSNRDGLCPSRNSMASKPLGDSQGFPTVEILMLSMHSEDTLVRQALDAGARGYVLKNAMELDLVRGEDCRARQRLFWIRRFPNRYPLRVSAALASLPANWKFFSTSWPGKSRQGNRCRSRSQLQPR